MNTISYTVIEPIARRIREARLERRPVQLTTEQVTLLDDWMQSELELLADAEWLVRAAATDETEDFIKVKDASIGNVSIIMPR